MTEKSDNEGISEEMRELGTILNHEIENLKQNHRSIIRILFAVVFQIFTIALLLIFSVDSRVIFVILTVFWIIELILLLTAIDWGHILKKLSQ